MTQVRWTDRPTTVYRCYAEDGMLLYVGISQTLPNRLRGHLERSPWWSEVREVKWEVCDSREAAEQKETYLINRLQPVYNKHKRRAAA